MKITLRDKRQITIPRAVCRQLGIGPGDRLELQVDDSALIIRPGRVAALDALEEIRRAIAESEVSEKELLEGGRRVRDELFREKYPKLAKKHGV